MTQAPSIRREAETSFRNASSLNISRRDFLKTGGVALVAAAGAAFVPQLTADASQQSKVEKKQSEDPWDYLDWSNSPLHMVERGWSNWMGETEFFGPAENVFSSYKKLTFQIDDLRPRVNGSKGKELGKTVNKLLDKYEKVVFIQKQESVNPVTKEIKWKTLKTPGTWAQMDYAKKLYENRNNILAQRYIDPIEGASIPEANTIYAMGQLYDALMNPEVSREEAELIINEFVDPNVVETYKSHRNDLKDWWSAIPDSIPVDLISDIHKANFLPPDKNKKEDSALSDWEMMDKIISLAGVSGYDAVWVPKAPDKYQKAFREFEKGFIPIPEKPKIYCAETDDWLHGKQTKILVQYGTNAKKDILYDSTWTMTLEDNRLTKDDLSNAWQSVDQKTVLPYLNETFGIKPEKVTGFYALSDDDIGYAMAANKGIGLGKYRLDPAIFYKGFISPDSQERVDRVLMLGKKGRDILRPTQSVEQSWQNWIVNVGDKVNELKKKGIDRLWGLGLLPAAEAVALSFRGLSDPYNLKKHEALLPQDSYLYSLMANKGVQWLFDDSYDPETNMAFALRDTQIKVLTGIDYFQLAQKLAVWARKKAKDIFNIDIEFEAEKDKINDEDCIIDGKKVVLDAGAMYPMFPEKTIMTYKGKKYVILEDNTDFNLLIPNHQTLNGILAIPLEEAKRSIIPIDRDNNLLNAAIAMAKITAIWGLAIGTVVAPEATALIASTLIKKTGKFSQKQLTKFYNSVLTTLSPFVDKAFELLVR